MKIRVAVTIIVLALSGVLTGGTMRSAGVAAEPDDAGPKQIEPTLNQSFGFPVWVYVNSSRDGWAARRAIYLFAEPQHFCEGDLRTLFSGLAVQYPPPVTLFVTAASDREFLQRKIEVYLGAQQIDVLRLPRGPDDEKEPDELPVDTGCFLADYARVRGREEAFEYNPDPHKVDRVKVVLTPRPDPYTGQINLDLLIAAKEGDAAKAGQLVDRGAEIETKDSDGDTALMIAASASYRDNGQSQVAKMLLARGADVNARDNEGFTPLLWAAGRDQPGLVHALISQGANVNAKNRYGYTPLMAAADLDNVQDVEMLLATGAMPNARDNEGKTALIHGVEQHDLEIVRALIKKGANINHASDSGETALGYAVEHDLGEIVTLLKNAGTKR